MEKIEAFKRVDDFLNTHEELPGGTMLFSHNRMLHTYLIKAWETPEKSVPEVGLKKFTFNELQQKHPKWNKGLIELELLHKNAAKSLSEIYINRGLKPGLAYDHAYEILETYASYRLLKGLIY